MTYENHVGTQLRDLFSLQYANKNVELKVIKDVTSVNYDILQRKKAALKEERKELDNVNYDVWAAEDTFCHEIWNFSLEHNFNIFNQYPAVTCAIESHNCQYSTAMLDPTKKDYAVQDLEQNTVIKSLKQDIDALKNEILFLQSKTAEEEIKDALFTVNNLRSFSEEISNLIRSLTVSKDITNIPVLGKTKKNKQPLSLKNELCSNESNENTAPGFINAKTLIKKSKPHPYLLIGRKIKTTITTTTTTEKSQECASVEENSKFGKFVVKKRSHISLKFEQNRKNFN